MILLMSFNHMMVVEDGHYPQCLFVIVNTMQPAMYAAWCSMVILERPEEKGFETHMVRLDVHPHGS